MKDLTPQKKVKEWVQNLSPTKAATSDAILITSSDKDSNTSLAGNLSEAGTWKSSFFMEVVGQQRDNIEVLCHPLVPF